MKIYILIVIIIILIVLLCYMKTNYAPQKESFQESRQPISNRKIVMYYTDWCGYSQQLLPEWNKFVQTTSVATEKVECDKDGQRCQKEDIKGYPTVVLYNDGKKIIMDGRYPRTSEGLIQFAADNK
jgi:thiol-disulfide isomerase/thioredoxin